MTWVILKSTWATAAQTDHLIIDHNDLGRLAEHLISIWIVEVGTAKTPVPDETLKVVDKLVCLQGEAADTKASDSREGTPLWKERFYMKVTTWLIYGLKLAVLEKNLRPASMRCGRL